MANLVDQRLGNYRLLCLIGQDVFALGTDSGLYHNYWDGNWHGWNDRID